MRLLPVLLSIVLTAGACTGDPLDIEIPQQQEETTPPEDNGNNDQNPGNNGENPGGTPGDNNNNDQTSMKIKVSVNGKDFTATLEDNESAKAFKERLPLTLTMDDVNGNEKYVVLGSDLPGTSKVSGTIHAGDLKIWSRSGLVLFYETFSSGYSYYNLGHLDDPTGIAAAVGTGSVKVTFSAL